MASTMGIPEKIKSNVRSVLQSKNGGVPIAVFFKTYMDRFEEPLDVRKMGFKRIEDFVIAIPDIARLELSQNGQGYRILKVTQQNSFPLASTDQEHMPASHLKAYKTAKRTSGHNASSDWDNEETDLQPDAKGLYSLCFSGSNKPSQPLEPLFNQAGPLCGIHENKGMVFIQYYSRECALNAIDMFPHLNLRATRCKKPSSVQSCSPNEKKQIKSTTVAANGDLSSRNFEKCRQQVTTENAQTGKRAEENFNRNAKVSPSKECESLSPEGVQKTPFETPSVNKEIPRTEIKLFISNISASATKEELYELLGKRHHVVKFDFKIYGCVRFAFVTMRSQEEADVLMQEFDSMLWHGRTLSVHPYQKRPQRKTLKAKNSDKTPTKRGQAKKSVGSKQYTRELCNQTSPEEEMPPLEDEMPELEEDIPELEVDIPELEADISELEMDIPHLEGDVIKHEQSSVTALAENNKGQEKNQSIIIENFPDETSERELIALFYRYHPINVTFTSSKGCKKAVIQLTSPEDAKKAVAEMNQQVYMGKTLLIDLPSVSPPHKENEGEPVVLSALLTLREFITKQMAKPLLKVHLGQRLEVLVTSVVNDRFFWGQVVTPESEKKLKEIAGVINSPLSRQKKREGYGRCVAVFETDDLWYRAWIFRTVKGSDSAGVFFIDYGNTASVSWDKIAFCTNNTIWDQCAMATPFTLTDPVVNLKERELTCITVEVTTCETEGEEGNFVIARPISLTGMSQILVAAAAVKQMTLKNRHVQSS